jgi:hypothetical protein
VAKETKATLETESLDVIADRGYFSSDQILACEEAAITVTLPKPMTSNSKAEGRFGKQDFRYVAAEDVSICPAGERLPYHYTNEENGSYCLYPQFDVMDTQDFSRVADSEALGVDSPTLAI